MRGKIILHPKEMVNGNKFYDHVVIKKEEPLPHPSSSQNEMETGRKKAHDLNIPQNSNSGNNNPDEGTTLFQGKRGEIKLHPERIKAMIRIFKDGKQDTIIHEYSYLWLDTVQFY